MGYRAAKDSSIQLQETNDNRELVLKVLAIDRISWCSGILKREDFLEYKTTAIRPLWATTLKQLGLHVDPSDQKFHDFARAFYVTVVAGLDPERHPAKNEPMKHFWNYLANCYDIPEPGSMVSSSVLASYKQLGEGGDDDCIVPYLPGRRLFTTDNGHVGYGAAALRE